MNNKNNLNELSKWNVRTDLAYDEVVRNSDDLPDYIESNEIIDNIPIYKSIIGSRASNVLNKKQGIYYTLDLSKIDFHDCKLCEQVESALAKILNKILINKNLLNKKCLLVGLGNINVTPDSLGPYVIDNVIVTRHLVQTGNITEGFSEVSALSPGVMGNTGIETFDIIKAVKDKINVDFIIVIDALASSSIARVNKTIQRVQNDGYTEILILPPKTISSNRIIPIPKELMCLLKSKRAHGTVLKQDNGKTIEPRLMQIKFKKYTAECGIENINFHSLRHSFATRCVELGFDVKTLSEILGHSDVKTTLNKYVHSSMEQKAKQMDLLKFNIAI